MNEKKEMISRMILSYLRSHPDAGDALEGITRWWLELEKIEFSLDEVAEVLDSLVQKGIIRTYKVKDGTTFYKINKGA